MFTDMRWHHELDWRPWSYTDFTDPTALIINGIRGHMRRYMARTNIDRLVTNAPHRFVDDDDDEWLQEWGGKPDPNDNTIGTFFNFTVGEKLPKPLPGEIEIARVVIYENCHVTTATGELRMKDSLENIFSIRARWRSGRYRYRVVDDLNSEFHILPQTSPRTLTLSELIKLLDTGRAPNLNFECDTKGLVRGWWDRELARGYWQVPSAKRASVENCTDTAQLESELYPMLPVWYKEQAEEWIAGNHEHERR